MSVLSSSSIESQRYAVFFVSLSSCSSEGSHTSSISSDSFSLSSRGECMFDDVFVSHQTSLFFEALGKKVGTVTAGSPCIPSTCHTRLIVCRMCLVGVKILTVSSCRWILQESWSFCSVSDVGPHFALRAFHVPLAMVHPLLGWARVVKPSCVMTVDPCMCSPIVRIFVGFEPSPIRCRMLGVVPLNNLLVA